MDTLKQFIETNNLKVYGHLSAYKKYQLDEMNAEDLKFHEAKFSENRNSLLEQISNLKEFATCYGLYLYQVRYNQMNGIKNLQDFYKKNPVDFGGFLRSKITYDTNQNIDPEPETKAFLMMQINKHIYVEDAFNLIGKKSISRNDLLIYLNYFAAWNGDLFPGKFNYGDEFEHLYMQDYSADVYFFWKVLPEYNTSSIALHCYSKAESVLTKNFYNNFRIELHPKISYNGPYILAEDFYMEHREYGNALLDPNSSLLQLHNGSETFRPIFVLIPIW